MIEYRNDIIYYNEISLFQNYDIEYRNDIIYYNEIILFQNNDIEYRNIIINNNQYSHLIQNIIYLFKKLYI